ncbi:MAG: response regulator [Thermoanaerobaculia bacterium]
MKKILLADDSVTIQKVVELTFMDEDFEVETVGNGSEAISRLTAAAPDLVITDIHMPGATGYEVCKRAKELHPGLPVLLLVGTFEVFDAAESESAGADGHLKKPFDSQELLRRVRELVSGSRPPAPRPAETVAFAPRLESPAATTAFGVGSLDLEEPTVLSSRAALFQPEPAASASPAPAPAAPAPPPPAPVAAAPANGDGHGLSEADVDRIARRIVELIGDGPVREVAWEVVPDLAEVLLKARIRELESQVE